jgi:hypothetical protein
MRHLVLLALFFAACQTRTADDPDDTNDPDDPTADGTMTVDLGRELARAQPIFVAIDPGDGWVTLSTDAATAEVEVPKDAETWRSVTVCPGPWEGTHEVSWVLASYEALPQPQIVCAAPDEAASHTTSGTGTGTYDLVQVSLGSASSTFFPYMGESFEIVTPPGTFDLLAVPIASGPPSGIVAIPGVVTAPNGTVEPIDFAYAYGPEFHSLTFDGAAPSYVSAGGVTIGGTTFFYGSYDSQYYVPPAESGVEVEYVVVEAVHDTSSQFFVTTDIGDLALDSAPRDPFDFTATVSGGTLTVQPMAPIVGNVQAWMTGPDYAETRLLFTIVGGPTVGPFEIPLDPSGEIEGFPAVLSGQTIGEDMAAWGLDVGGAGGEVVDDLVASEFARDGTRESFATWLRYGPDITSSGGGDGDVDWGQGDVMVLYGRRLAD